MSQSDMTGKNCVVTGATSGIGEETALALAARGADLALTCRSLERGEATKKRIEEHAGRACVRLYEADFERLSDVRRVSAELLADLGTIHVLHNNAGITNLRREETPDGFEATFAVNHLAPFLLTCLLMPRILEQPGARIVNVASEAHRFARFDLDDLMSTRRYSSMGVYGASKLANMLFTIELARRLEGRDVRVWSLHPGAVATRLGTNNPGLLTKLVVPVLQLFFKSPEDGAATSIQLCADESVDSPNGTYFADCRPKKPKATATDHEAARRLWDISEQHVDLEKGSTESW